MRLMSRVVLPVPLAYAQNPSKGVVNFPLPIPAVY
jgi:hypothetical protein